MDPALSVVGAPSRMLPSSQRQGSTSVQPCTAFGRVHSVLAPRIQQHQLSASKRQVRSNALKVHHCIQIYELPLMWQAAHLHHALPDSKAA